MYICIYVYVYVYVYVSLSLSLYIYIYIYNALSGKGRRAHSRAVRHYMVLHQRTFVGLIEQKTEHMQMYRLTALENM